jgi:hypothetical protein
MAIFLFILTACIGLGLTIGTIIFLRKRRTLNPHQYGLILAIGICLTWLLSFFTPLFSDGTIIIDKSLIIFGIGNSILGGIIVYVVVRIYYLLNKQNK